MYIWENNFHTGAFESLPSVPSVAFPFGRKTPERASYNRRTLACNLQKAWQYAWLTRIGETTKNLNLSLWISTEKYANFIHEISQLYHFCNNEM